MTISSLFELIAASIGVVGSLFFAIGVLRQSTETMQLLSYSWTTNEKMRSALAMQKADYLFGWGFILLAFLLQLTSFFFTEDFQVLSRKQARLAPLVTLVSTIVIFPLSRWLSLELAKHFEKQIKKQVKESSEEKT